MLLWNQCIRNINIFRKGVPRNVCEGVRTSGHLIELWNGFWENVYFCKVYSSFSMHLYSVLKVINTPAFWNQVQCKQNSFNLLNTTWQLFFFLLRWGQRRMALCQLEAVLFTWPGIVGLHRPGPNESQFIENAYLHIYSFFNAFLYTSSAWNSMKIRLWQAK